LVIWLQTRNGSKERLCHFLIEVQLPLPRAFRCLQPNEDGEDARLLALVVEHRHVDGPALPELLPARLETGDVLLEEVLRGTATGEGSIENPPVVEHAGKTVRAVGLIGREGIKKVHQG